jgi:hypothetical protein
VVRLPFPTSTPDFRLIHASEPIPARAPISPRVRPTLFKIGGNREMDFRVSVLPTLYGEKIVLRLLDKSTLQLDMTKPHFPTYSSYPFKSEIVRIARA